MADDDPRLIVDEQVGQWYLDHRSADSTLFTRCVRARAVHDCRCDSAIPVSVARWCAERQGRAAKLVELFAGDDAPTFVAVYQNTPTCNPSGEVTTLLRQRYTTIATVDRVRILGLRDDVSLDQLPGRRGFTVASVKFGSYTFYDRRHAWH